MSLLTEVQAALGSRQAELELISLQKTKAQKCVQYYCRSSEVAVNNMVDAGMQAGKFGRSPRLDCESYRKEDNSETALWWLDQSKVQRKRQSRTNTVFCNLPLQLLDDRVDDRVISVGNHMPWQSTIIHTL
ncbi:hypothetical protein B0H10DRAFT_1937641 [Mycena sp. CBHHK59/15]|nr:hypothetical protein B0H10DRAFT_1937641 [Mycena sp. CBHHK59/15]